MSQENVAVVEGLYASFAGGDRQGVLDALSDDIEWSFPGPEGQIPFAGVHNGKAEVEQFFELVVGSVQLSQQRPIEVLDTDGPHVISRGREAMTARSTGKSFESEFLHLYTLSDGKIVAVQEYYDTAAMADAFDGAFSLGDFVLPVLVAAAGILVGALVLRRARRGAVTN
jgi:ketosteroid isomerase-like protein